LGATASRAGSALPRFEDLAHTGGGITVDPVASSSVYRNTTTNLNDSSAETTTYSYTWYTGTVQMQSASLNRPVISAAENGPGVADSETRSYDVYGRVTQLTDADGYVHTIQYDQATGAVTQTVVDSGTGHLNLTTTMVVDSLGRTTKMTDPNGNSNVTYTVYNDPNHEVRVYSGWNGTTTAGPTQVSREDRAHSPSYTESFTMSATPHVTSGQPDGIEAYAFLQSLSRTITSPGGQVRDYPERSLGIPMIFKPRCGNETRARSSSEKPGDGASDAAN
jgi:YD repeat-containing protein